MESEKRREIKSYLLPFSFSPTHTDRYGSQYATGQDLYGYYHDDESAFQLVDTVKVQRQQMYRNKKWQVSLAV